MGVSQEAVVNESFQSVQTAHTQQIWVSLGGGRPDSDSSLGADIELVYDGLGQLCSQKRASWLSVSVRVRVSGFRPHQETSWAADNLPKLHPLRCPRGLVLRGELSVSVCLLPADPGRISPRTFFSRQNREGQPGLVNSTPGSSGLGLLFWG